MRESRPAHTFRRRTISIAAVTVAVLGATTAQALAASELSPGTVYFTTGALTQTVTLTAGENLSVISAFRLRNPNNTGDAPAGFSIGANTCGIDQSTPPSSAAPKTITAGTTCTVSVTASGGAPLGASLQLATAAGTSVRGALLKANAPAARVCTDPTAPNNCNTSGTLAFSAVIGTPSTQTFQIKNGSITNAFADLHVSRVDVTGPYTADASACATVPIAGTCPVVVTFNPTTAGTLAGTLNVVSDDPIVPGPTVTLTGLATARALPPPGGSNGNLPGTGTNPGSTKPKKPSVTGFVFSPKSVTIGGKGSFKYTLAAAGRVTIKIDRRLPGKRIKYQHRGTLTIASAKLGKNVTVFKGKFAGHTLPKGTYKATISARNSLGRAMAKTTTFIVKAKH